MTVSTNQLLLRKNFTNTKRFIRGCNALSILFRLQVKNIISLCFLYTRKRFFFSQSLQHFNCFNNIISGYAFQSGFVRQRFFFSLKNKNELTGLYSYSSRLDTSLNFNGLKRTRFNVYLQQLA